MLRRSRAVACLVMTLAAVWWTCAAAAAEPSEPEMVDALNDVRARHGLGALRLSPSLEGSAANYAAQLMRSNQFAHAPEIRASRRFRTLGEILAIHPGGSPLRGRTVRGWLAS
ncbi:MAG: CAP domain-containing protein, partial [Gammaproteobacteria bacterium]